jgi:hypothetical protein
MYYAYFSMIIKLPKQVRPAQLGNTNFRVGKTELEKPHSGAHPKMCPMSRHARHESLEHRRARY